MRGRIVRYIAAESEARTPLPESVIVAFKEGGGVGLLTLWMPATPDEIRAAAAEAPGLVVLLRKRVAWREPLPAQVDARDVVMVERAKNLQRALFDVSNQWGKICDRYSLITEASLALGFTPTIADEAYLILAAWENVEGLRALLQGDGAATSEPGA